MKPLSEKTFVVICRRPTCGRVAECRGLCGSDYRIAHQLVTDGVTNWPELERLGKANEPKRTAKAWFLDHVGK